MQRRSLDWIGGLTAACFALTPSLLQAADLFVPSGFNSLAADRRAEHVGDSLTIVINQSATASNSASSSSAKSASLAGQISTPSSSHAGQVGWTGDFNGAGQTGGTDQMVAQLGVTVDAVLPNGDLHVTGAQLLTINGERTHIRLSGRVRPADISATNSVVSTSLADAVIEYDGKGFVARSAKPGIVGRIFSLMGLL